VALKLFREGNNTVKAGVTDIYLYTLSHSLDRHNNQQRWIEAFMPDELRAEYTRQHNASAP